MDGDEAPLTGIVELAEKYGAMVMVDEAHATGIFGAGGAGVVQKLGLGNRVLVQMGTLGKALGGFGAYIAGSRGLRDLLINRCRSFIFTTSLPPAVMAMAMAALDLVKREPERREALWNNCRSLKEGLRSLGFELGASESPILPLIIGDATECMRFSEKLLESGVFAQGIRPPTVPPGTSRLRITLMATHTREQIERALDGIQSSQRIKMTTDHDKLKQLDHTYLWHPFTQMQEWMGEEPCIISGGDGNYLVDVHGRKYLDGVSSLWCNVHGHRKKELDDAIREQLEKIAHSTLLGIEPRSGDSIGAEADRDRAQRFETGFLFRQRRHGSRDRPENGRAILAAQGRIEAHADCIARRVLPRRHRRFDESGLFGNFSPIPQKPALPGAAHHAAACVSLLSAHE